MSRHCRLAALVLLVSVIALTGVLPTLAAPPIIVQDGEDEDELFFTEEFNRGFPDLWEHSEGWLSARGIVSTDLDGEFFNIPLVWDNFRLQIRLRCTGDITSAVMLRATDETAYQIHLMPEGIGFYHVALQEEPTLLHAVAFPITEDWHDLEVVMDDAHVIISLDAASIGDFDLPSPYLERGSLGMYMLGEGTLYIDSFVVGRVPITTGRSLHFRPTLSAPPTVMYPTAPSPTPRPPQPAVTVTPSVCTATPNDVAVNIRTGDTTAHPVVGGLSVGASINVIGRNAAQTWYQVRRDTMTGWVSGSVVILSGPCGNLPVVQPPAPPAPTAAFNANVTSGIAPLVVQFTDQSSGVITSRSWNFGDGGTSADSNPIHTYNTAGTFNVTLTVTGPGGTHTAQTTITVTAALTDVCPAITPSSWVETVDAGFIPDPKPLGAISSGGTINLANCAQIPPACRSGWVISSPDISIIYNGPSPTGQVRFFYQGSGTTTMLINDASGSWRCSIGGVPAITFQNPVSGRYDIWIGSATQDSGSLGMLYITEL